MSFIQLTESRSPGNTRVVNLHHVTDVSAETNPHGAMYLLVRDTNDHTNEYVPIDERGNPQRTPDSAKDALRNFRIVATRLTANRPS